MKILKSLFVAGSILLASANMAATKDYSFVTWNVENWGTSDPARNATQLRDHFDNVDIFGLVEINRDADFALYADYVARDESGKYFVIPGTTGNNIRLGIFFREDKFEVIDSFELVDLQFGNGGRAPLAGHMRDKATAQEFLFVVNHFHRGNEKKRLSQAIGLREWAKTQTLPVVAVGDFNFDFDVDISVGNVAYDAFIDGDTFKWLKPAEIVATNWSDTRPQDGKNDYNSVLDFIFVAGNGVKGSSTILVRNNDFPDDDYTSDHRPIVSLVTFDGSNVSGSLDDLTPKRQTDRSRELAVFSVQPRAAQSGITNLPFNRKIEFDQSRVIETMTPNQMNAIQLQLNTLRNQIRELQRSQ